MNEATRALHDVSVMLREDYRQQTGIELPPPPPPPQRSLASWLWAVPLVVAVLAAAASPLFFPEMLGRNGQGAEIERLRHDLQAAEEQIRELHEKVKGAEGLQKENESLQGSLAHATKRNKDLGRALAASNALAKEKDTRLAEARQQF